MIQQFYILLSAYHDKHSHHLSPNNECYYNLIDYIPYAILFISYLFYDWKFVPLNPLQFSNLVPPWPLRNELSYLPML